MPTHVGILLPMVFALIPMVFGFHKGAVGQGGAIAKHKSPHGKNKENVVIGYARVLLPLGVQLCKFDGVVRGDGLRGH